MNVIHWFLELLRDFARALTPYSPVISFVSIIVTVLGIAVSMAVLRLDLFKANRRKR